MLKKILLAVAMMLPMLGASAQNTVKIGLVDTASVFQAMPDTKEAQNKLQEAQKSYQSEALKLDEEMKRLYDELSAMDDKTPPLVRERRAREFQDCQTKAQNFEQSVQQELARMHSQLMEPIMLKIKNAVESVGKEGGYSMIQDYNPQQTMYFASPVVDVTPQVKAKLGLK